MPFRKRSLEPPVTINAMLAHLGLSETLGEWLANARIELRASQMDAHAKRAQSLQLPVSSNERQMAADDLRLARGRSCEQQKRISSGQGTARPVASEIARSRTSSRPARMPATVGDAGTVGMMPTP